MRSNIIGRGWRCEGLHIRIVDHVSLDNLLVAGMLDVERHLRGAIGVGMTPVDNVHGQDGPLQEDEGHRYEDGLVRVGQLCNGANDNLDCFGGCGIHREVHRHLLAQGEQRSEVLKAGSDDHACNKKGNGKQARGTNTAVH